jgi:hypothetical protein
MTVTFQKAERKQSKLRLALTGASGSGKTIGALQIASGLGGRVAVLDTENGSASLYADQFNFDVINLRAPYTPERFIQVIKAAEAGGYNTLIIDSATHEWSGVGGCLELVDELAKARHKGNSWSAWNEVTPRHRAFIDAMLQSSINIIVTMRSKTETAQQEVNGKKQVVKLGLKSEQRDGIEYEFTLVLDLVHDGHYANATKDRTQMFKGDPQVITAATGEMLLNWLNSGKADATITQQQVADLYGLFTQAGIDIEKYCQKRGLAGLQDIKQSVFNETVGQLRQKIDKQQQAAPPVQPAEPSGQPAMSAFVLDLIRRAGTANSVKEANALFQYNNVQNLPEDEIAALRSAISHRLVQLDQMAKQQQQNSLSLADRIKRAPDTNELAILCVSIETCDPQARPNLYALYDKRLNELAAR